MRTLTLPFLLAAVLLTACDKAPTPTATPAAARSAASATSSAPSCPAEHFDRFLPLFENDIAIQKAYVTYPLQSDSVDPNADPEPKPVSKSLAKAEVTFPVMPSQADQTKDGLVATQTASGPAEVAVKLVKPDTDYQTTFFFRKDDCWHLYRVKDDSL
jgi:hypothetical protein